VRSRVYQIREVQVLSGHAFSGPKPKETAWPRGQVESNWR